MTRRTIRPTKRPSQIRLEQLEAREVPAVVGTLDPSFGTAGKIITPSGYTAIADQPDGKLVAVGASNNDFLIVRFNPDGSLDKTFNGTGIQKVDFAGGNDAANDVAIQADGKIVVVGFTLTAANGNDFAIARLNTDGTLDNTFDTDGKLSFDFGGGGAKDDVANGVAIAATGDIYVVGSATNAGGNLDFGVARISGTNGALVTAFGNNGKQFNDFGGKNDLANAIAIQDDGQLVIVGVTDAVAVNGNDFAIERLNPTTGQLDTTFNATGQKTVNFGAAANDTGKDVAIQDDGKIVVVGSTDIAAAGKFDAGVARLTTAGALDATFDGDGLTNIDLGGAADTANRVLLQDDGRIVLVGNSDADIVVARLLPTNGALDKSFNGTGKTSTVIGSTFQGNGGVLTSTGRIVVAGKSNANTDGALARLIGTVEAGQRLSTTGTPNGQAQVFNPTPITGQYPTTATATFSPISGFQGTVRTAVADVNGDGVPDTVAVTGPGTAIRLTVISGVDNKTVLVAPFDPFGGDFTGGGFVTAGDLDNDGKAEFAVSPDQGGGPRVTIFSFTSPTTAPTQRANFFGIDDPNFRGGCRPAFGDANGDGVKDLAVAAGFLGGPRVALFNGTTLFTTPTRITNDFFAFPGTDSTTLRNGAFVSMGDINGDGFADLIFGGGPGGAPRVFVLSGQLISAGNVSGAYTAPVANFFVAGNTNDRGGVRVAATDADGDNKADLAVGSGENVASGVRVYLGSNFTAPTEPTTVQSLNPFNAAVLAGGVYVG